MELDELLKNQAAEVGETMRNYLASIHANKTIWVLKVIAPDIAVFRTDRSEWGGSGGIGKFHQVNVYYKGQVEMQEWQWRDRWSASNDKPWNYIGGFGEVSIEKNGEVVRAKVELPNNEYGNRTATFNFRNLEMAVELLTAEDQKVFAVKVEKAVENLLVEKMRLWEAKPQMMARYPAGSRMPAGMPSYVGYKQPWVKEKQIFPDQGIAAFVLEEQIDHHCDVAQMRYELYVFKSKEAEMKRLYEDNAYENEGSAVISIVQLNQDAIIINCRAGKKTIKL
jgi:hypothetical protein